MPGSLSGLPGFLLTAGGPPGSYIPATMKAKLLHTQMGKPAGAIFDVVNHGTGSSTLKDSGGEIVVPTASIEILPDEPATEVPTPAREQELPVEPLEVSECVEARAREGYDAYCEAVGGVAFNGDPLPKSKEFFTDPAKTKQANGWRKAAEGIIDGVTAYMVEDTPENHGVQTMRAKLQVSSVTPVGNPGEGEDLSFHGVSKTDGYPEDGLDEDNTFAKFSPSVDLKISVRNPALFGKFHPGQKFYVDFIETEDSPKKPVVEDSSTGDDDRFAEESLPESGEITEEQASGNGEGSSSDPAEDSQLDEKPEKE